MYNGPFFSLLFNICILSLDSTDVIGFYALTYGKFPDPVHFLKYCALMKFYIS
jgi:hypothetical protein